MIGYDRKRWWSVLRMTPLVGDLLYIMVIGLAPRYCFPPCPHQPEEKAVLGRWVT